LTTKIYVVNEGYNYEGSQTLGVFSTEEKAKEAVNKLQSYGDYVHVIEYVVDTPVLSWNNGEIIYALSRR
jgi:endo-alpha-1,4-polygalactosaminidase (GH114 family)